MTRLGGTVVRVDLTANTFVAGETLTFEVVHKILTDAVDTLNSQALVDVLVTIDTGETRRTGAEEISSRVLASGSIFTRR